MIPLEPPPLRTCASSVLYFLPITWAFPKACVSQGKVVLCVETLFLLKEVEPEVGMWSSSVGHPQARLLSLSTSTHRMVELPPSCGLSVSQALP